MPGARGGRKRTFPFLFREENILRAGARSEEAFRNLRAGSPIRQVIYGILIAPGTITSIGIRTAPVQMYVNTGPYLPLITEAEDGLYRGDEDVETKQPGRGRGLRAFAQQLAVGE